jgi:hypothetical protein
MQDQPFTTQNRKLAEALALAGCKWAAREDGGPTMNVYTADFLRSRRLLPATPVNIPAFEAATRAAFDRRIPGIVTYLFVRDDVFFRAVAAWDEVTRELQRADKEGRPPTIPPVDEETVSRVMAIAANSTKGFSDAPFVNPAWCSTIGGSETTSDDGKRRTISGKGKAWQVTISKEDREKLKL